MTSIDGEHGDRNGNVASLVFANARRTPERTAIVFGDDAIAYDALAARAGRFADGLRRAGLREGDRVVLLAPLSADFFALALGLLASGLVVVLLDGRMGLRRALRALRVSRARAVVTRHGLLHARGRVRLEALLGTTGPIATAIPRRPDDRALISFTSGTTGRPKGADRTHGLLLAQHAALRASFPDRDDDVDMPCFPAVVLHNLCCGLTTVLPPCDLRHPAEMDPARVLEAIRRRGVTRLSAAPAFLGRLVDHMLETGERAPSMRQLVVGGAPVSRRLAGRIGLAFPGACARVAYGSTEAEPIASIPAAEVASTPGDGFLVGTPAAAANVVILPSGELLVSGPHVNQRYVDDPAADRAHKLRASDGTIWHRTGDVARRDAQGRIWLLGRIGDAIVHDGRRIDPFTIESGILDLPGVRAASLLSHPRARTGVVFVSGGRVADIQAFLASRGFEKIRISPIERMPTDPRHQSRTDRNALRKERLCDRT